MNTYFFLIVIIIFLLLSLFITEGDLFFPSNIVMVMYLLSLFFLIGEMKKWDGNLSFKGMSLLILGLTIYLIVALVVFMVTSRTTLSSHNISINLTKSNTVAKEKLPVIDKRITIIIILYEIFATLKYYLDVKNSSSSVGLYSSFSEMIGNYRNAGAYGTLNVGISAISAYNYQIMLALAYVYASVVTQNLALKEKTSLKWKLLHWSPIVIYGICSIFTGGRNPLINLGLATIVMYFIKLRQINKINPLKFKTIFRLVLGGSLALVAFSSFRGLVGRTSDYTTFDYLAMYIGAPIKLFDLFINGSRITHRFVGQETFTSFLGDIGKDVGNSNLEFRSSNGFGLGNVYTPFRRYYSDFGITGLMVLTSLQSFIYSLYYSIIVKKRVNNGIDFFTILYSYMFVGVVYYSVDERLYTYFFSRNTIKGMLFMLFFAYILPKIKIKIREVNLKF